MNITQGALTMVGLNTVNPTVFWNGIVVPGILGIRVDWEDDEARVKLSVTDMPSVLQTELLANGIRVKLGANHE